MADGMSFRGCLSGGGDIFSKSVEKQGGANRTFATGGRCHGWQLEPCPCGLEPLLTFRQKIPTGRPYIEEGHSVRHGRSWICFTNSQFNAKTRCLNRQRVPFLFLRQHHAVIGEFSAADFLELC